MNGSDSNSKQQNDLSFQIDYRDFKQHVWDSLADLNSSLRNLSSEMNNINSKFSPIQPKSVGNGTPDRSIISVLEARISSLERQLDEKQRVIELLIGSGPKQQANPTQASSSNNAQKSSHVSSNSETQNKQLGINTTFPLSWELTALHRGRRQRIRKRKHQTITMVKKCSAPRKTKQFQNKAKKLQKICQQMISMETQMKGKRLQ